MLLWLFSIRHHDYYWPSSSSATNSKINSRVLIICIPDARSYFSFYPPPPPHHHHHQPCAANHWLIFQSQFLLTYRMNIAADVTGSMTNISPWYEQEAILTRQHPYYVCIHGVYGHAPSTHPLNPPTQKSPPPHTLWTWAVGGLVGGQWGLANYASEKLLCVAHNPSPSAHSSDELSVWHYVHWQTPGWPEWRKCSCS